MAAPIFRLVSSFVHSRLWSSELPCFSLHRRMMMMTMKMMIMMIMMIYCWGGELGWEKLTGKNWKAQFFLDYLTCCVFSQYTFGFVAEGKTTPSKLMAWAMSFKLAVLSNWQQKRKSSQTNNIQHNTNSFPIYNSRFLWNSINICVFVFPTDFLINSNVTAVFYKEIWLRFVFFLKTYLQKFGIKICEAF